MLFVCDSFRFIGTFIHLRTVFMINYRPTTKMREGNVVTGVFLSFCWAEQGGSHVTITNANDALEFTVQPPPPRHRTPCAPSPPRHGTSLDREPLPLLVTSGCHHWRPCSLEDPPPTPWQLKHVQLAQAGMHIILECFII